MSTTSLDLRWLEELTAVPEKPNSDYAELKTRVKQAGLLKKQLHHYVIAATLILAMMAGSIYVASTQSITWLHIANGAFMAVVFAHLGFLAHDAGHLQIFRSPHRNYLAMLAVGFLIGLSPSWWLDKHNNHHANTNDVDHDLDINLPIIAFNEEQARSKRGIARLIVKYQAFLFFPLLLIEAFSIRADSTQFIMRGKKVKARRAEAVAIIGHFVLYFWLAFEFMSPVNAIAFILVHQGLVGVYMGSVFAPNHKGMLLVNRATELSFLRRQVLTSRNIRGSAAVDYIYGGLNYQIEHHLFPTIPRNKLSSVQPIIRQFCQERGIPYHETGVIGSYREVLGHLEQIGSGLRRPAGKTAVPQAPQSLDSPVLTADSQSAVHRSA